MRQLKSCFLIDHVTSGTGRIYASLCFNLYHPSWLITKIICTQINTVPCDWVEVRGSGNVIEN